MSGRTGHRAAGSRRLLVRPRPCLARGVLGLLLGLAVAGSGGAAVAGPLISIAPVRLDFGGQPIGISSTPQTVTVTNTGNADLLLLNVFIMGADPLDFMLSAGLLAPITLAPGAAQTVPIVFTPLATGSRRANLVITDTAPGSPHMVPLMGTGTPAGPSFATAPAISISPSRLDFGNRQTGTSSAPQTLTIQNTGNADLEITALSLTGTNGPDFALAAGQGGSSTVSPGSTRTVQIIFTPRALGPRTANLAITDNATGSPHTVLLTGVGIAGPAPAPAPTAGDWPVFMHDPRQLGLAGSGLDPRVLSPWRIALGSRPGGSPVVSGGTLYLGTEANDLFAIDTAIRFERWCVLLPQPVRSTPAAGPDGIVVSAGGLYSFNASDGTQRWQRPDIVANDGVSPMQVGAVIYIGARAPGGTGAAVYAVNAATGANVWSVPAPLPAMLDNRATAAAYPELGLLFVGLGPAASGGTPAPPGAGPGAVLALRLADGGIAWAAPAMLAGSPPPTALSVGWVSSTGALAVPQAAVFAAAGGSVTALSASSGAVLWRRALPESALQAPPLLSSAAAAGTILYVGGASGRVYALESTTGADAPRGLVTPAAPIAGTLALAGPYLYMPTASGLVAVDVRSGAVVWSSPLAAASGVAVAGGVPFVAAVDGQLVGFHP